MALSRRTALPLMAAIVGKTAHGTRVARAASDVDAVLSVDGVRRIELRVDPARLPVLDLDRSVRVPCEVWIDGQRYGGAELRQKGSLGSASTLEGKPSFNVWFRIEKPSGLNRLTLNNARQDVSLLHEHLAYDLYRRCGLPGPRTAHGTLMLNDRPYGIYVVVEPVDDEFLARRFGRGNERGNLYEGTAKGDFLDGLIDPTVIELKDEEKGRTRSDLRALVVAASAPDDEFEAAVSERMDFAGILVSYALDGLLAHWDGPFFNHNNYYLYANPANGRLTLIPHGMDQVFDVGFDPLTPPVSRLAQRIRAIPDLDERVRGAMNFIMEELWDVEGLVGRMEWVRANIQELLAAGQPDDAVLRDAELFEITLQSMRDQVIGRREDWRAV